MDSSRWSRWNDILDTNIERGSGRTGKWTAVEDIKLKDALQTHGGQDWCLMAWLVRVERTCSVVPDGVLTWIPISTRQRHVRVDGQQTRTKSERMRYKHMVARTGLKLPQRFWVERKNSVGEDGVRIWIQTSTGEMDVKVNGHKRKSTS
jgi:hypothetical protein